MGLSGAAVERINRHLAKGRVVEISPPLTEADVRIPSGLGRMSDRLVALPTGVPLVTIEIDDDATIARGEAGTVDLDTQAIVFLQRSDSGFVLANKDDEGNFIANQMFLGNGFSPGDSIVGYDLLVYNDPSGGPASVRVSLWDGDPLAAVDTRCTDAPAPIPGTAVTFTDLPSADGVCPAIGRTEEPACVGLFRLTATLLEAVPIDCDYVWMVFEVTDGCLVGWRTNGLRPDDPDLEWAGPAQVGFSDNIEAVHDADTTDGTCCDSDASGGGLQCNHEDGDTSNDCAGGATFCTDGIAEYPTAFSYGFLGGGYYASLVAGLYSPPNASMSIVPMGNTPDGQLDPDVVIEGNEIRMPTGGRRVFLELRIGDWDPDDTGVALKGYRMRPSTGTFSSGLPGVLHPAMVPCGGNGDTGNCEATFGLGSRCDSPPECATLGVDCFCTPVFIDVRRNDFLMPPGLCSVGGYVLGCSVISGSIDDPEPFPDRGMYGASFVYDIAPGATGTFIFGPAPWGSRLTDQENLSISLLAKVHAKIVVNPDCKVVARDCNVNRVEDICDIADGTSEDCTGNNVPDECEPDCNGNDIADSCDIANDVSQDCDGNGVPDECDTDCNENGIPDACDLLDGTSGDCEGLITEHNCCETGHGAGCSDPVIEECVCASRLSCCAHDWNDSCVLAMAWFDCGDCFPGSNDIPDECEADCNANSVADTCDVVSGFSEDCTENGIPDECEPDCNGNGAADSCDVAGGAIPDCDGNGVPDSCDLESGTLPDDNDNGFPDSCEVPRPEPSATPKSRYISFVPVDRGQPTALRVTFAELPEPFESLTGTTLWVGEPEDICELGGVRDPEDCADASISRMASLSCDPVYLDWSSMGTIHVYASGIVPGGLYEIQAIDDGVSVLDEVNFSDPLTIATGMWGDVAGPIDVDTVLWTAPDGRTQVIPDLLAIIGSFGSRPGAPMKALADLEPQIPDQKINISDLVQVLDGIRGLRYPFDAPEPCATE